MTNKKNFTYSIYTGLKLENKNFGEEKRLWPNYIKWED